MKETNSPSAICKLTFDSASTLPSEVSNVSETSRTSTAKRCGSESDLAVLFMRAGSLRATNGSRRSGRSVTPGSLGFNNFGICNTTIKY